METKRKTMDTQKLTKIDTQTPEQTYLEFVNDFLTIPAMADFYGVDTFYLKCIIEFGEVQHRYAQWYKFIKNKKA